MSQRRRMDAEFEDQGVENFRGESLDRMLWLFLKLLHQKSGLERFLRTSDAQQMAAEQATAEEELTDSEARDKKAGGK